MHQILIQSSDSLAAPVPAWPGDPAELRRNYMVREAVPAFQDYLDRWHAEGATLSAEHPAHLHIRYGAGAEERVDLLLPEKPAPGTPVQILIHGGYWRALQSQDFLFTAVPGLRAGVLAVVVNYALCPAVTLDEVVAQCRRAFSWTVENIAAYGGDPQNLYLAGHSAGAHLAAMLLATEWPAALRKNFRLRGLCGVSGLYDLRPLPHTPLQADLRLTPALLEDCSPSLLPVRLDCPVLLAHGSLETPEFKRQSEDYAAHCARAGLPVMLRSLAGRNHYSAIDALAEPDHPLAREWLGMIAAGSA